MNDTAVEVLTAAAEQLRAVLSELERGLPTDMAKLEACAINLFTIVGMLNNLTNGGELLQRFGPPMAEEQLCDDYLRRASEELPAGRPHCVILASRLGRSPYSVSNIPPLAALELIEQLAVKITTLLGVARRVEEFGDGGN